MAFRFSIATALIVLTVGAAFSLVLAQAVRGAPWAVAIVAGVASVLIVALFHAAWYLIVRLASLVVPDHARRSPRPEEPPRS